MRLFYCVIAPFFALYCGGLVLVRTGTLHEMLSFGGLFCGRSMHSGGSNNGLWLGRCTSGRFLSLPTHYSTLGAPVPGVCSIDRLIAACLPALAVWILLSGLDDLFLDLRCSAAWVRRRWRHEGALPAPEEGVPEKPIAIFLPLWREHRVIGRMLAHNLAAIRYTNFSVFVGGYPNDDDAEGGARGGGALCERAPGAVPARRSHLEGRLPELDLSAHAAARAGSAESASRWSSSARRGGPVDPDELRWTRLPLHGPLRHGADPRAAAADRPFTVS